MGSPLRVFTCFCIYSCHFDFMLAALKGSCWFVGKQSMGSKADSGFADLIAHNNGLPGSSLWESDYLETSSEHCLQPEYRSASHLFCQIWKWSPSYQWGLSGLDFKLKVSAESRVKCLWKQMTSWREGKILAGACKAEIWMLRRPTILVCLTDQPSNSTWKLGRICYEIVKMGRGEEVFRSIPSVLQLLLLLLLRCHWVWQALLKAFQILFHSHTAPKRQS